MDREDHIMYTMVLVVRIGHDLLVLIAVLHYSGIVWLRPPQASHPCVVIHPVCPRPRPVCECGM